MRVNNKYLKKFMLVIMDFLFILTAFLFAFIVRYKFENVALNEVINIYINFLPRMLLYSGVFICLFAFLEQYNNIWSVAGMEEYSHGVFATLIGTIIIVALSFINNGERFPIMVSIISGVLIMVMCEGIRAFYEILSRKINYKNESKNITFKNILVIGAGEAGSIVVKEYNAKPRYKKKVVALIDDDKEKIGTCISGVRVLGTCDDLERIVKEKQIKEIIIAIANISDDNLNRILNKCEKTSVQIKIMPGVSEMLDGKFNISKIRDVDVRDLLGRKTVSLDTNGISNYIAGKIVMVTGGGGSIGSEILRQLVRFNPKKLIIFDIYENNAYDIQNELKRKYDNIDLVTLIGSVRDRSRLKNVFNTYKPDVVFHAAAHKHVPLMEDSPGEAIKNNVVGTLNTAEIAGQAGASKFVLISTDKAVNPTNVMGASKRLCEMIIQSINKIYKTDYVAVRFGNVLGSNGSVVPLFKKQISEGGPVTLTHKNITRFFMTIPEAAQLVIQAGAFAKGGEIFVLDMGKPVKIYDLAVKLIKLSGFEPNKDIEIKITGLRPGEKLYEELLMNEEGLKETKHNKIFIGKPGDFDFVEVKRQINELVDVIKFGDNESIKYKLKEIVVTFKEPDEVNKMEQDLSMIK